MKEALARKMTSDGAVPERQVHVRAARALTIEDMRLMRLPERYWASSFDRVTDGKHKTLLASYLRKIHVAMSRGAGIMLWGENSVGKTSAAAVVAKHARRFGYSVLFIRASELLKACVERTWFDATKTQTVYERAAAVDLLVVDDLGHEHHAQSGYMAGYADDLFEDLLRERTGRLRATIVTTNLNPSKIGENDCYKRSMRAVMKGSVLPVRVVGPDRREAEGKDILDMLSE